MSTDILDIEINKYLPLLGSNEKRTLITVIQSFLSLQGGLQGISIPESYNREIDDAMERIDKGIFVTDKDVEQEMKSW